MQPRQHLARVMAALLVVGSLLGAATPAAAITDPAAAGTGSEPAGAIQLADFGEPFHFLAPLGAEAGDPAKFDASLLDGLIVTTCRVEGTACTEVKTLTSASSLSERLRIGMTNGKPSYYLANWDVSKLKLEPYTFRVTVTVAQLELGSIDVGPATYKSFGRTWPIKFRIENNPTIRIRVLTDAGKGPGQIANAIRLEFGICGDELAQLLADDLEPFTQQEIDLAIAGACQDAELFPTTKIADQATSDALTAFDPTTGQMTFSRSTPVLANLKAGDVLVGEPATAAAAGYLRKITSITKNKKTGVITVETTQALLNEAVKEGTLDGAADLKPADLVSSDLLPGVILTTARPGPQRGPSAGGGYALVEIGDGLDFHETVDVTLEGSTSGEGVEGTGTVRIRGRVDFNAGWNIGIGIESCLSLTLACVDRFEAHVGADLYSDLQVDGVFDGRLQREVTLSTHYFTPIVFFIGPIPVVIIPIVKANAGIDGTAHVEFSFDAQIQSSIDVGAKWTDPDDNGVGWEDIADFPDPAVDGDAEGDLVATMTLKAYAEADAKLLLYGIAGPGAAGKIGMRADVQYPGTPLWKIFGYVGGETSFSVDLGGVLTLGDHRNTFLEEDFELAAAENQAPTCGARTTPIPVAVDDVVRLGPRFGGVWDGYFDCTDPEGGDTFYSAVEGSEDIDLDGESWSTEGLHYVQVTASDEDGKSRSFTLTIQVIDTPPILSTTTASTSVPAGVQYWVTASAWDVEEGGFLACSPYLTWSATGGTVTRASSLTTCTVVVVFTQTGPQTITVVATDPNGKASQQEVHVNVTAAPANAAPVIALDSFDVRAASGPPVGCGVFDPTCWVGDACASGFDCPVWQDAILFNGMVFDGDYHTPLTFKLSASDPNGDPLSVTWFCQAGLTPYLITDNGDGSFSCSPFSSKTEIPILVWAEVSDGTTTVRSEVRRMLMLDFLF